MIAQGSGTSNLESKENVHQLTFHGPNRVRTRLLKVTFWTSRQSRTVQKVQRELLRRRWASSETQYSYVFYGLLRPSPPALRREPAAGQDSGKY
uniref:Uncharacterized protein n=1 Tax=Steinernema glaseri TaxID=37863 RepID=A0A1I7YUM8_9BILA